MKKLVIRRSSEPRKESDFLKLAKRLTVIAFILALLAFLLGYKMGNNDAFNEIQKERNEIK